MKPTKKSKAAALRRSKKTRLIVMGILLLILAIMYFTMEKFRIWIIGLAIALLVAFGFELSGTDYDLGKAWEDKSFSNAKVAQTENGTWLIGECQKKANFNCDNFAYQDEAQDLFDACGGVENDIHGLDRDKDGIVCESNRKRPEEAGKKSIRELLGFSDDEGEEAVEDVEEETGDAVDALLAQ